MAKSHPEYQYLDLLKDILKNGHLKREFNTGIGLKSVFGRQIRFDLSQGFPLLTTKKVFIKGVIHELLWFISGSSNVTYLTRNGVHIWDDWAYKSYQLQVARNKKLSDLSLEEFQKKIQEDDNFAQKWGEIGPVYGYQWRKWPSADGREIDQLAWVIEKIALKPQKKHYIVSAWNPEYIYEMAAPGKSMVIAPCHTFYHVNIAADKLSLQLYQRSADMFLGVPFNIASYALLSIILAQITGYEPGEFIHTFGDVHIYENHVEQVKEQLSREPKPFPTVTLDSSVKSLDDFKPEHVTLENYETHPVLRGDLTVAGGFFDKKKGK